VLKWFVERIYKRKSNFKMLKGVIQERKSGLKTMINVTKDILQCFIYTMHIFSHFKLLLMTVTTKAISVSKVTHNSQSLKVFA